MGLVCKEINKFICIQAKSEEQVALERSWVGKEHLWLVHQRGFSSVMGVSHNPPAVTVTVNSSGEEMVVDEDEVEKVKLGLFGLHKSLYLL